ncbi:alpha/beta hydrolase [Chelativorans sp. J32]|uniref:alpha/beta hydrolase n=1 Tax=Chelativorans sp. J32 TaxID=935840 RepID=UPI0009FBCD4D|nr:alpha/beta hydrolase [Chelativorans sp. J32]
MKNCTYSYIATILIISSTALLPGAYAGESPPTAVRSIAWSECPADWFPEAASQDVVCGTLDVPMQRYGNQRSRESVRLALSKLPATGEAKGSVILVAGGPGQSGLDFSLTQSDAMTRLRASFDIIGYDPRGIGRSEPKIVCNTKPDVPSYSRQSMEACLTSMDKAFLAELSTLDAVDDLNDIRAALGDEKITLVAYSYGTMVAQLYAERYPFYVRAMVLDGVVDLSENYATMFTNQLRGFNLSFYRFAQYCANTGNCPLSASPADATATYRSILASAERGDILRSDGTTVTAAEIYTYTMSALYSEANWSELAQFLSQLGDGSVIDETAEELMDSLGAEEATKAQMVITCADYGRLSSTPALPFLAGTFAALEDDPDPSNDDPCSAWPFEAQFTPHIPRRDKSLPPLLFVSQTGDPTTPYGNAVKMSAAFESPLITRDGNGHSFVLIEDVPCVDDKVVDYIRYPNIPLGDLYCR